MRHLPRNSKPDGASAASARLTKRVSSRLGATLAASHSRGPGSSILANLRIRSHGRLFSPAALCLTERHGGSLAHCLPSGRRRTHARFGTGAGLARGFRRRARAGSGRAAVLPMDSGRRDGRRRAQSRSRPGAGPVAAGAPGRAVCASRLSLSRSAVRARPVAGLRRALRRLSRDVAPNRAGRGARARPRPHRRSQRLCRGDRPPARRRAHGDRRRQRRGDAEKEGSPPGAGHHAQDARHRGGATL